MSTRVPLPVGAKVKFFAEKQRYTVQASDERFAICTKPFNCLKTVLYTIIDFDAQVRGPENMVFGLGAETREQCEQMLDRLNGRHPDREATEALYREHNLNLDHLDFTASEVSYRHRMALDLERVDAPPFALPTAA